MAETSSVVEMIAQRLEALREQRCKLQEQIDAIDVQLERAAAGLGLSPKAIAAALPRIERLPRQDSRSVGTMPGKMLEILFTADKGYTRSELKDALKATEFKGQLEHNPNGFYNAVIRYIKLDKIVEVDGYLYHPSRAPLPEGEADPTGQHLPGNVSSLFGKGA